MDRISVDGEEGQRVLETKEEVVGVEKSRVCSGECTDAGTAWGGVHTAQKRGLTPLSKMLQPKEQDRLNCSLQLL